MKKLKRKLRRLRRNRIAVTSISGATIGVLLVIGGLVGGNMGTESTEPVAAVAVPQVKVEKKRGKFAAENSEKFRFFANK